MCQLRPTIIYAKSLKYIYTYLSCVVKVIWVFPPLVFVSFVSNIIQFTFILSIYISPTIKVNADTIGFQKAHRFIKLLHRNVSDANDMIYEASTFKCFFRPELQGTTMVCFRECFQIEEIYVMRQPGSPYWEKLRLWS